MSEQHTERPGTAGGPSARPGSAFRRRLAGGALAVGAVSGGLAFTGTGALAATGPHPTAVRARLAVAPAATPEQDVNAFFKAGYTFDDAWALAALWASPTIYDAKVKGGARLLAGHKLPKIPTTFTKQQDVNGFLAVGYDYQDGLALAAIWGSPSVRQAKIGGGAKLLAGGQLPKFPKTYTRAEDANAFLASGYSYADAVKLAKLWHSPSVYSAKVRGGAKLLAGGTLPIKP